MSSIPATAREGPSAHSVSQPRAVKLFRPPSRQPAAVGASLTMPPSPPPPPACPAIGWPSQGPEDLRSPPPTPSKLALKEFDFKSILCPASVGTWEGVGFPYGRKFHKVYDFRALIKQTERDRKGQMLGQKDGRLTSLRRLLCGGADQTGSHVGATQPQLKRWTRACSLSSGLLVGKTGAKWLTTYSDICQSPPPGPCGQSEGKRDGKAVI